LLSTGYISSGGDSLLRVFCHFPSICSIGQKGRSLVWRLALSASHEARQPGAVPGSSKIAAAMRKLRGAANPCRAQTHPVKSMLATVFEGKNDLRLRTVPRPFAGVGEAVIRITATTICGTDLRGEYPVRPGLINGHEPVGVIEEQGYRIFGSREDGVLKVLITP
jgi:hypothetical protein